MSSEPVGQIMSDDQRLRLLESVIERGRQTFVEVGSALMEIREDRLYRDQGFTTFEDYCHERWGWTARRARQLTDAAQVIKELSPIGDREMNAEHQSKSGNVFPLPTNARQAAELSKIADPEVRREVWHEAVAEHGENITAAKIAAKVAEVVPPKMTPGERDRQEALARMGQARRAQDMAGDTREHVALLPETPVQKEQRYLAIVGDGEGKIARARLKQALSDSIVAARNLWALNAESLAGVMDDAERRSVRETIRDGRTWFDAMEHVMSRGMHVVKEEAGG
ncbi:MAG: hypothetical protein LC748_00080 [Thermomicrobia bacterium]|nr:hypothetical protein [Thermomicrobia bacterium]